MAPNKAAVYFIVILLAATAGCGVKASPRPFDSDVPAAIADLAATPQEDYVLLTWTAPGFTEDQKPLSDLAGFVIYRAELKDASACPRCPFPWEAVREIIAQKDEAGKAFQFVDRGIKPQKKYVYKVQARNGWGESSRDSNQATLNGNNHKTRQEP